MDQVNYYFEGNEQVTPPKTDGKKPAETPPEFRNPTIEQLAGINVYCEEGKIIYLNGPDKTPEPDKQ